MRKRIKKTFLILLPLVVIYLVNIYIWRKGMYESFPRIDVLLHFVGGSVATWAIVKIWNVYSKSLHWKIKPDVLWFFCIVSFVGLITIVWEWHEFLSDYYLGTYMQEGLADTMKDLFFGLLGAITTLIIWRPRQ